MVPSLLYSAIGVTGSQTRIEAGPRFAQGVVRDKRQAAGAWALDRLGATVHSDLVEGHVVVGGRGAADQR